jgi:meiotically up-regulated gene 157 (Mug157) protein
MHESFDCNDASRFTRPWFAWANSMFGELILQLHEQQPHLLRRRWS